jgi:hypothetical protein
MHRKSYTEHHKGIDHLGDLGLAVGILLKWMCVAFMQLSI